MGQSRRNTNTQVKKPDRVLVRPESTAPHSRDRILCVCNALVRGGE